MAQTEPTITPPPGNKTNAKDIAYDGTRGRLYESAGDQEGRTEFQLKDQTTGQAILLTKAEKERIFLDALRSYYFSGRQMMSDDDFDLLKQDLSWEGSQLVYLTKNETLFLTAMSAYLKGQPIMSDAEFDEIKASLSATGSSIAVNTEPTCYVDTGVCKVTWREDDMRKKVLYVPGAFLGVVIWIAGVFELVEPMRAVNPIFSLLLGSPFVYTFCKTFTEKFLVTDPFIAQGPCPACQTSLRIYFGDVLGDLYMKYTQTTHHGNRHSVEGYTDEALFKCPTCKAQLSMRRATLRRTPTGQIMKSQRHCYSGMEYVESSHAPLPSVLWVTYYAMHTFV